MFKKIKMLSSDFLPSMLSVNIKSVRCQYGIPISRIANAFIRRDRDVTHTETNSKVGCEKERAMAQTCFPSTGPAGRLSRKDKFEYHILREIPPRIDLFEAIEELCKYYIDREPGISACSSVKPRQALYMNYINIDGGVILYYTSFLSHIDTMEV